MIDEQIQSNTRVRKYEDPSNDISYKIEKFYGGTSRNSRIHHRITATTKSEKIFKFVITKRGGLSKLFGMNKGVFNNIHKDFNVSTTNPIQISSILSILYELDSFSRNVKSIDVKSQKGLMTIKIEQNYANNKRSNAHKFVENAVNFVEYLVKVLLVHSEALTSKDPIIGVEFEEYICFNCDSEISFVGDICTNCGVIAPKCVICFYDPEPNQEIILFDCCKSYAHRDHALTWINTENICPSCRASEPQLIPIEEETRELF